MNPYELANKLEDTDGHHYHDEAADMLRQLENEKAELEKLVDGADVVISELQSRLTDKVNKIAELEKQSEPVAKVIWDGCLKHIRECSDVVLQDGQFLYTTPQTKPLNANCTYPKCFTGTDIKCHGVCVNHALHKTLSQKEIAKFIHEEFVKFQSFGLVSEEAWELWLVKASIAKARGENENA